jgi:hypothetical protein
LGFWYSDASETGKDIRAANAVSSYRLEDTSEQLQISIVSLVARVVRRTNIDHYRAAAPCAAVTQSPSASFLSRWNLL